VRRCRREDAFYGLGEKAGRLNKQGREFTMWNLDVLSPPESAEFTARYPTGDPRADRTSAEMDPYYVNIPLLYHCDYPAGAVAGSFVDNGFRGSYDFTDGEQFVISFEGGQYTEYIFAGPEIPDILATYTWLTGRMPLGGGVRGGGVRGRGGSRQPSAPCSRSTSSRGSLGARSDTLSDGSCQSPLGGSQGSVGR